MTQCAPGAGGNGHPARTITTPGEDSDGVTRWLTHVSILAEEIGPRGPTTAGERRALDYCAGVLSACGLRCGEDRFTSTGSVFRPHLVAAIAILVACALYPVALPASGLLSAALVTFVMVCEVMELTLRRNPLQLVPPRRPSANVYGVLEPGPAGSGAPGAGRTEVMRDIVLIGHVDTQRTPRIFSSPGWFLAYRIYSTVAFGTFILLIFVYGLGALFGWRWAWPVSTMAAVLAVLLVMLCLEAESSPFTRGANDNATGAGLVLALAQEFASNPLPGCRMWFVCSGCEEALHEGAKAFFAAHKRGMVEPRAVTFEMLGCAGPAWLVREGIVLPLYSDHTLRALAEKVARDNPHLGAYAASAGGGVTEMSDALLAGVPAITVMGLTRDGRAPYWHTPADTVDKIDPETMQRNYRFVRALVEAIAAAPGPLHPDPLDSPGS